MRIIHLSDTHFSNGSSPGYQPDPVRAATLSNYLISQRTQLDSNIVIITGDLTDNSDDDDFSIARAFIKTLKNDFQVYSIPGNHDYCTWGSLCLNTDDGHNERRTKFHQLPSTNPNGENAYPWIVSLTGGGSLVLLDSMREQ
jgi:3',5'-cyclic AMP phosphodiesterase CpdA